MLGQNIKQFLFSDLLISVSLVTTRIEGLRDSMLDKITLYYGVVS